MSRPLILYHAGCFDGFTSAFCAWKHFGDDGEYVPVQYGEAPPDVKGRDLYILDFSYKNPVMRQLIQDAGEIVVLDHHKTAAQEFIGLEEYARDLGMAYRFEFDMEKSGGRLAWEQFFPGKEAPWIVAFTEDRDLWRHQLPNTKEINAFLRSYPMDFALWNSWCFPNKVTAACHQILTGQDFVNDFFKDAISQGSAILRAEKQVVDNHVSKAIPTMINALEVLAVNATVLVSEIGHELALRSPSKVGATYFINSHGKKVWSLRSTDDGPDVSEIAKRQGGGGHKGAAGFTE